MPAEERTLPYPTQHPRGSCQDTPISETSTCDKTRPIGTVQICTLGGGCHFGSSVMPFPGRGVPCPLPQAQPPTRKPETLGGQGKGSDIQVTQPELPAGSVVALTGYTDSKIPPSYTLAPPRMGWGIGSWNFPCLLPPLFFSNSSCLSSAPRPFKEGNRTVFLWKT